MNLDDSTRRGRRSAIAGAAVVALATALVSAVGLAKDAKPYSVSGTYVEGCSCSLVCSCNLTGDVMHGCQGVGALVLSGGKFNGQDLAGAKVAIGMGPGQWVRVYVDAKSAQQREAAADLARTAVAAYGTVESVKDATIELTGADGKYMLSVDGGKVMSFTTEPFFGLDKKTPVVHMNTMDPFNPTIYQARTISATYKDDAHSFTLAGSNSYFNPKMKSEGAL